MFKWINSYTGRMLLGLSVIHIGLTTLLFYSIFGLIKLDYKKDSYERIHKQAILINELLGHDLNLAHFQKVFERLLVSQQVAYVDFIDINKRAIRADSDKSLVLSFSIRKDTPGHDAKNLAYVVVPKYFRNGKEMGTLRLGFDESHFINRANLIYQLAAFIIVSYSVLSLFLIGMLSTIMGRSIRKLRQLSQQIANGNSREKLIFKTNIIEIAELASDLEHMRHKLIEATYRQAREKNLEHMATHDGLTGLANRTFLYSRLAEALQYAHVHHCYVAVIFMDLDGFKPVNDTYGHAVGDLLMQKIAERLVHVVRSKDLVARIGGDEFALVLADITEETMIDKIVVKTLHSIAQTYVLEGNEIQIFCSIGVSVYPRDGNSIEELLKKADKAMYQAKQQGGNNYLHYS